jgi:DNA helicase HerA-like ATPase
MRRALEQDFDLVFGSESIERFALGSPLAMPDTAIPVDLARLIERPSGIFGQTGAGKSVLARLILFGLIKSRLAATLIFDMHDEYATGDPHKPDIPGLRSFFPASEVLIYQLDPRRSQGTHIRIGLNHIQPDDIELLRDELDLSDTFFATTFALYREFGERWLASLLNMDGDDLQTFAAGANAHPSAVEALQRKLRYLQAAPYTSDYLTDDPVGDIVQHLERGQHVIVQFGPRFKLRDYLLVANLLTRRIHGAYTERSEREQITTQRKPLVVVLEEAHKFLNPTAARQSIFGTIAREMRKYGVTLLVVDQRPSGIDSEILSQLGTRITGLLSDTADIDAVLSGAAERTTLRALLASLEPSRQCLIVGHAIPMPMVLQTREYGAGLQNLLKERDELAQHGGSLLLTQKQRRLAD